MEITAQLVKELRERSGVGMMDCKTALKETNGDLDAALTWLREKGIAKAAKKQSRIAAEGLCSVVENGNTAILFELNSETDFVSKNDSFLHFLSSLTKLFGSKLPANDAEALALTIRWQSGGNFNFRIDLYDWGKDFASSCDESHKERQSSLW
jgi:elongation factor Ts